ncbi:MAG: hypothetical protein KDB07_07375 [Planctomycetes bacterium]|nr:hypothetical protein [Planctomycetota bacterium]
MPILGNERTAPRAVKMVGRSMARALERGEKLGHASFSAFADELQKISYVPNTEGDRAGVWRALLASLVGKAEDHTISSYQLQEELTAGGRLNDQQNYAQEAQSAAMHNLLRDSQLRAALEAQGGGAIRSVM